MSGIQTRYSSNAVSLPFWVWSLSWEDSKVPGWNLLEAFSLTCLVALCDMGGTVTRYGGDITEGAYLQDGRDERNPRIVLCP